MCLHFGMELKQAPCQKVPTALQRKGMWVAGKQNVYDGAKTKMSRLAAMGLGGRTDLQILYLQEPFTCSWIVL